MFDTLRAAWRNNQRIAGNFFSLSVLRFANYLAPLITLPYLVRVLGPSRYGPMALARVMSVRFAIPTDDGFNLSATRWISVNRGDSGRASAVFLKHTGVSVATPLTEVLVTVATYICLHRKGRNIFNIRHATEQAHGV
ncbi:MAG: oligosaccharide flippase family protein [Planctomycetota bacterium]|jgi:PST family polysaccharide transporter